MHNFYNVLSTGSEVGSAIFSQAESRGLELVTGWKVRTTSSRILVPFNSSEYVATAVKCRVSV